MVRLFKKKRHLQLLCNNIEIVSSCKQISKSTFSNELQKVVQWNRKPQRNTSKDNEWLWLIVTHFCPFPPPPKKKHFVKIVLKVNFLILKHFGNIQKHHWCRMKKKSHIYMVQTYDIKWMKNKLIIAIPHHAIRVNAHKEQDVKFIMLLLKWPKSHNFNLFMSASAAFKCTTSIPPQLKQQIAAWPCLKLKTDVYFLLHSKDSDNFCLLDYILWKKDNRSENKRKKIPIMPILCIPKIH